MLYYLLTCYLNRYFSLWLNRPHCELANDIVPYKRQAH